MKIVNSVKKFRTVILFNAVLFLAGFNSFSQKAIPGATIKGSLEQHALNTKCKTILDSLTNRVVYISADTEPVNDRNESFLRSQWEKLALRNADSTLAPGCYKIKTGFIVNLNGTITGKRIIEDKQVLLVFKCWR